MRLSKTSKMGCVSFALPARIACNRGNMLARIEGTICSKCYASRGHYQYGIVRGLRLENHIECLKCENTDYSQWIENMVELIRIAKTMYFRWFDSGDVISHKMAEAIIAVAIKCPMVRFWVPTKEGDMWEGLKLPENLVVRISHDFFDEYTIDETPRSMVFKKELCPDGVFKCPAPQQGGKCLGCSKCWEKTERTIGYNYH